MTGPRRDPAAVRELAAGLSPEDWGAVAAALDLALGVGAWGTEDAPAELGHHLAEAAERLRLRLHKAGDRAAATEGELDAALVALGWAVRLVPTTARNLRMEELSGRLGAGLASAARWVPVNDPRARGR